MRKILVVLIFIMWTSGLFAADFLAGGYLQFNLERSSDSSIKKYTHFDLDLFFGRYVIEKLIVGGEIGYHCTNFRHTAVNAGAFVEYDFLKRQYFSLGIKPSLNYIFYRRTTDPLVNGYPFNRNSIELGADLRINLFLTQNIELFTTLLNTSFQRQWWHKTESGKKSFYGMNVFNIEGLNHLKLGVKFRF